MITTKWFWDIELRAWVPIRVKVPEYEKPEPSGPNPGEAWSEDERQHAKEWATVHADR